MTSQVNITSAEPWPFLRRKGDVLERRIRIGLHNAATAPCTVALQAFGPEDCGAAERALEPGETVQDLFVPESDTPAEWRVTCAAESEEAPGEAVTIRVDPCPRLTVHLIHRSHHDVGYTDLPSRVIEQHAGYLASALDMAAAHDARGAESQFRIVIEQAWSLCHFLRHASPSQTDAMLDRLRSGQFELTALFGNMTSELCSHEELLRTLYPAFALKRRHAIPLVTAELNDVPGLGWGLCQALCESDLRLFCPGIPDYYHWGHRDLPANWDADAMVGGPHPGAFWWEAPSGKRILTWVNRTGGGGGCYDPELPGLDQHLAHLASNGYRYSAVRWNVAGSRGDNSPYSDVFCDSVDAWNADWASPRLMTSTLAQFYQTLKAEVPDDLPVHRGELPGQDYPPGAMCTAAATVANREAHGLFRAGEQLAAAAAMRLGRAFPRDQAAATVEAMLFHDEHTWGYHFPCGPAAEAATAEKSLHGFRALALAHDLSAKAMAAIADHVQLAGNDPHLVVFNTLPHAYTGPVQARLREMDNVVTTRPPARPGEAAAREGLIRICLLNDRWQVNLSDAMLEGDFELVDPETDIVVPCDVVELDEAQAPAAHAPDRVGLGTGGNRYGIFERPVGLKRELHFVARDVPACGYRAYRLRPAKRLQPVVRTSPRGRHVAIENEYYRIVFEPDSGRVTTLLDLRTDTNWIDPDADHPFGALVVRDPASNTEHVTDRFELVDSVEGTAFSELRLRASVQGHPAVHSAVVLHKGSPRIEWNVRVLRDATPLLETNIAFPFAMPDAAFLYEGGLSVIDPDVDLWPHACWNRVTVQDWVAARSEGATLLWTPRDAPVAALGRLWPAYTSPAHACVPPDNECVVWAATDKGHLPAHIYSTLFANNFGTNFRASQTGSVLFRYAFTTRSGRIDVGECARLGAELAAPAGTMLTGHHREREWPSWGSFLQSDNANIRLLTFKPAENDEGWILRLWNPTAAQQDTRVGFPGQVIRGARLTDGVEQDSAESVDHAPDSVSLTLPPCAVVTVRLVTVDQGGE